MRAEKSTRITAIVIFSVALIFSFVTATFAWLFTSKDIHSEGMDLEAGANISDASIVSYACTAINGNNYTFDENIESLAMPKYDRYSIDYKVYEKALVVKLTFSVEAQTSTCPVNVVLRCSSNLPDFSTNDWKHNASGSLSNVASLYKVTAVSDGVATVDGTERSFVSKTTGNPPTKAGNEIVLWENYVASTETPNVLYFVLTYNTDVANYYCDLSEVRITYENDVTFMIYKSGVSV